MKIKTTMLLGAALLLVSSVSLAAPAAAGGCSAQAPARSGRTGAGRSCPHSPPGWPWW